MPLVSGSLTAGVVWFLAPGDSPPPALGAGKSPGTSWDGEHVLERRRRRRADARRTAWVTTLARRGGLALTAAVVAGVVDPLWTLRITSLCLPALAWRCKRRHDHELDALPEMARMVARELEQGATLTESMEKCQGKRGGPLARFLNHTILCARNGMTDADAFEMAGTHLVSLEGRTLARLLGHPLATRWGRVAALRRLADLTEHRTLITRRARLLEGMLGTVGAVMVVSGIWFGPTPWAWGAMGLGSLAWWWGGHDAR